jgi:hypothetical protein
MWITRARLARAASTSLAAALLAAAAAGQEAASPAPAAEPAGGGSVLVTLADGTSLPLQSWSLSYEYLAWKQGTSQHSSTPMRKEGRVLWIGKKVIPADGLSLTIEYGEVPRESDLGSRMAKVARGLQVVMPDGRKSGMKPEAPHKDLLLPGADRSWLVMPRSLDLKGQTVTGTRKEYCLVSYSTLVECGATPTDQVVKLEFTR